MTWDTGAEDSRFPGGGRRNAGGLPGRWIPAMAMTLLLMPGAARGDEAVPQPVKAGLQDLVSGRTASDETDSDEGVETLSCSVESGMGKVEFSLGVAPTGAYRWAIRQGTVAIDLGILESRNGWKASRGDLAPGAYTLEVTRPGNDGFRRRIDFTTGAGEVDAIQLGQTILDRHAAKDYQGVMKALGALDIRALAVPPQMREDLAWSRIDGMFFFRKFEDIFPAIEAFKNEHPASARRGAVTECEMAARFERGLKKSIEAVRFRNAKSDERRTEGVADLGRFLSLAAGHQGGDYTVLPKRELRQDLWTARVILGDEQAILKEIPAGNAAAVEKFRLLCAQLYPKIRPDQADANLQRMKDFLAVYPQSTARPRVEFEMADVALEEGIRLVNEVGDPAGATTCFDLARGIFHRIIDVKSADYSAADVAEAWDGILRSYYWQHLVGTAAPDKLLDWSRNMIEAHEPGSPSWRQAKQYQASMLAIQRRHAEAAVVLDELVALGFKGNPSHDGPIATAVSWRIGTAHALGDEALAEQLRQSVRESNCVDSIRRSWKKGAAR